MRVSEIKETYDSEGYRYYHLFLEAGVERFLIEEGSSLEAIEQFRRDLSVKITER